MGIGLPHNAHLARLVTEQTAPFMFLSGLIGTITANAVVSTNRNQECLVRSQSTPLEEALS